MLDGQRRRCVHRLGALRRRTRLDRFEEVLDALDDLVVLEAAGGRDDDVRRPVVLGEEGVDLVAGERGHSGFVAEHLAPKRMIREDRRRQQRMHLVVGRVLGHGQLLEDDVPFGVDLVRSEGGLRQHSRQQLEPERQLVGRQARVVRGVLARGERVHLAAERVDRLCDLARGLMLAAFEHEVLEEVRRAGQLGRLVTSPYGNPESGRNRSGVGHPLSDDADAVGQAGTPDVGFSQR